MNIAIFDLLVPIGVDGNFISGMTVFFGGRHDERAGLSGYRLKIVSDF